MKTLAEHMSVYAAYHRDTTNRAIHYVMVPLIAWTLMVALDHVRLLDWGGTPITAAMLITIALLIWYLALDFALGAASVFVFTVLLVSAMQLNNAVTTAQSLWIAGALFVASWVFQILGHSVWEKRRPALVDNLFQVFVAPMFLISEAAFSMGLRKDLEGEVVELMQAHLPA